MGTEDTPKLDCPQSQPNDLFADLGHSPCPALGALGAAETLHDDANMQLTFCTKVSLL
jgi:hypothetical protein